jgi:hypothetical protein
MVTDVFRDERHCDPMELWEPSDIPQDLSLCILHLQNTNYTEENTSMTEINHFHEIKKLLHLFFNLSHYRTNTMKIETVLKNSLFLRIYLKNGNFHQKKPLESIYHIFLTSTDCSISFNEITKHSQKYLKWILHTSVNYAFQRIALK